MESKSTDDHDLHQTTTNKITSGHVEDVETAHRDIILHDATLDQILAGNERAIVTEADVGSISDTFRESSRNSIAHSF